jgi:two-component system, chemotaxis family, sensor kinase Cph1
MVDVKILLVEDENIESLNVKNTLESFGFDIPHVVTNGKLVIEKALEINPDLILLDLTLIENIDAIDIYSYVNKLNIPFICLNTHSLNSKIELKKILKFDGCIIHPFDNMKLDKIIKQVIYKNKTKNEFLENIVENIPNMIFIKSSDTLNFELINKAGEKLLGHPKVELLGKNDYDFFPKNEADFFTQMDREVLKNKKLIDIPEETIKTKNFGQRILHTKKIPLLNKIGEPEYLLGISEDITELKKAEKSLAKAYDDLELKVQERTSEILKSKEELIRTNRYNRELLEVNMDPLVTIGSDGNITDVNKAVELVTGYSRDQIIGTDFSNYFTDYNKAKSGYEEVFRNGMVKDYPLEIQHKTGSTTPVLYNASVYKDENGKIIGIFAAARDISQLKKAENKLENLVKRLEISNKELEQFAYVASHDLKEPLRMITSFLHLLKQNYSDNLDENANDFINFAMNGASRMDTMINDLLEYSRIGSRAREYKYLNCEDIVEIVLINLKTLIDDANVKITQDSLPIIYANEHQMVQLFQNLISNAIKYNDKKIPKIHISVVENTDENIFSIEDNGIGIDQSNLKYIFTIFHRLHTNEEYDGTGIGLAISKKILQQHQGKIWAKSKPGKGTTFYFTLPHINY